MHKAAWVNGKRKVTGCWIYNWAADNFTVELNSRDRITGQQRVFRVYGDTPEWGNWKLVREKEKV